MMTDERCLSQMWNICLVPSQIPHPLFVNIPLLPEHKQLGWLQFSSKVLSILRTFPQKSACMWKGTLRPVRKELMRGPFFIFAHDRDATANATLLTWNMAPAPSYYTWLLNIHNFPWMLHLRSALSSLSEKDTFELCLKSNTAHEVYLYYVESMSCRRQSHVGTRRRNKRQEIVFRRGFSSYVFY